MATFLKRLKEGLSKTKGGLINKVTDLISLNKEIDEDFYEELEEILIGADVGVNASLQIVESLRDKVKERKIKKADEVKELLKEELAKIVEGKSQGLNLNEHQPAVIMVVGVNGVGKTTTIGKLAFKFKEEGKKVLLAAGDTFRAAAIEQLEVWANRSGSGFIKHQQGSDPAAVAFDAIQAAKSRGTDVVIIDTAGRLQTKVNLMQELQKVKRVIQKEIPDAPHETLLVLDATTGQNAISQAKLFDETVNLSGIVLTKLDGTAKGGVVFGICSEMEIPVKFIGIGERIEDLREFNPENFVEALFDEDDEA
ncbi:MAG: fused signal recognition particle receptor [Clostridia bacterium]|jgi:fused signal recognition particle receptor|nr:signal recognition particle-docking protein FtsY [Clostridiales bacterium]MDK2984740.1 fused signal recognition particle receptor [Clostridia bacterium]